MKKLTAVVIAATVLLVGCGGGGSDEESKSTTTTTRRTTSSAPTSDATTTSKPAPSLEEAVRAYTVAFLGGDDTAAYDLLSERCHGEMASADFKDIVDRAADTYAAKRSRPTTRT